ncbi:peroxiredoxin Q [Lentinula aff. detonsa]|uniref:thioredoxin-dependent peroxiredoxin n=1 Tax=Lentinula aff. detonsa TaxID=2804958 RepID=A0AA38KSV0_9AGAR|nr:peroxiredoxin Q [Lentinula aff. detonsa]KAJ3802516.1 peroxiredoxin Q [Lentinula aff. detonsa]
MAWKDLIGKTAPSVTLPNYNSEPYTINPGKDGVPIALFFYPQSGSYGCTKEACQFRDALAEKEVFKDDRAVVIGVSPDSVEKQKVFVEKQKLTYPVLSDEKLEARTAYKVGKGMMGLTDYARVTFIIDGKGIVRDALDATMNYGAHSKFVTKWLEKLQKEKQTAEAEVAPAANATEATPAPDAN